ncbi:MAG TPA: ribonuclease P protein component [Armatimonadetes bacterium]|jgi:ribonuclease P protein component|nr:ribonuclease P protein component [Armatimonadota bacterium]
MVRDLARVPSIRLQRDFRRIFARGRRFGSRNLTAVVAEPGDPATVRIAFVTSRKVGKAVRRNRVRRRLRHAAWELVSAGARPHDVILIARPSAADSDYVTLRSEVHSVLARAGVIAPDGGTPT